ncbi:MAG: preprotein translocase subunit SecE [Victivallaceae bacterium]
MGKVRGFFSDTIAELKRCTWPTRSELFESTLLVIVAIVVLASFVGVVDYIARFLIDRIVELFN